MAPPLIDQTVGADSFEAPAAGQIGRGAAMPVPESVAWIEIVEDLRRDVVEVELVEPETEPVRQQCHGAPKAPAGETPATVEPAPAAPGEVNAAGALTAMDAVLTISLEPEWPGNVHVYDIRIDVRYGTFTGVAARSSDIPGETIGGVFSVGLTDIDFTAVYPTPAPHYTWCGSGPLRGFTGTDSRGNVLHTVSATVTNLADVIDGVTDETARLSAARAVEAQLDEAPPADESLEEAAAADTDDEVAVEAALGRRSRLRRRVARPGGGLRARWARRRAVADASVDLHLITDEHDDVAVAELEVSETRSRHDTDDEVADEASAEPSIEVPVASDEVQELDVVPEVAPEQMPELAVADVTVGTPTDDIPDHAATCRCLACLSTVFEPVPVTEGPLAGKAFYFRASQQDVPDLCPSRRAARRNPPTRPTRRPAGPSRA